MVTLELTTTEAMQLLVAYHELLQQYERVWALSPDEDHTEEREWYEQTLQKIAEPTSKAIFADEGIRNYIASQQTEAGEMVTVESVIKFDKERE